MSLACPYCHSQNSSSESRYKIVSFGHFVRKSDQTKQQRYLCKPCRRSFSAASFHPCFKQHKRHLNPALAILFASGISLRRAAKVFHVNRKTVVRKQIFLGLWADHYLKVERESHAPSLDVQFDDLETFEHSKMKPLSVITMVDSKTRRILGFRVARMPAKGLLVKKSLKKYGLRKDQRKKARRELFKELKPYVHPNAFIKSDESPHYPHDVRMYFPKATHWAYKGKRGCIVGQGELKGGGFDPLFSLNHTYAMFRANISRLFRRTWNTTKKPERLALHLAIYALFHNTHVIHNPSK